MDWASVRCARVKCFASRRTETPFDIASLNRISEPERGEGRIMDWASDRLARSVKHLLACLDELDGLGVEYVSFRENIDTSGPLGRAVVTIIGAIAELERSLSVERVRGGMRRARLEGQHICRQPLELDHAAIQQDRLNGQSIRQIARGHRVPTATIQRIHGLP